MKKFSIIFVLAICAILSTNSSATDIKLTVEAGKPVHAMSKDMYGLFFEDINFAADGGLYAEMVWNRSFEFSEGLFSWKPGVLNGADLYPILLQNSATFSMVNIVGQCLDGGFVFQVSSDKNVSRIGWGRAKPGCDMKACVQTFAANGEIVL